MFAPLPLWNLEGRDPSWCVCEEWSISLSEAGCGYVEIWLIWLSLQDNSECSSVASWCCCQTNPSYLLCWCFIVSDWNWVVLFWASVVFYDRRAHRDPLQTCCVVSKCPGISWNIWLDVTQFLTKNIHFCSTRLDSDSSGRCEYWVCVNRWWRAETAEGSELSSLPARLSPCKGMLAHITLRDA